MKWSEAESFDRVRQISINTGVVMLDHVGIRVSDLPSSPRFYDAVLRPLGHERCYSDEVVVGYGPGGKPSFWLHGTGLQGGGAHIAFASPDRQSVEAFHSAGLAAGGMDNGAPGPRPDYGPEYFAAFLIDPDGNNIEAVCMKEES